MLDGPLSQTSVLPQPPKPSSPVRKEELDPVRYATPEQVRKINKVLAEARKSVDEHGWKPYN